MGQTHTISKNNTSIRRGTDNEGRATLTVRLHSTDVVTLTELEEPFAYRPWGYRDMETDRSAARIGPRTLAVKLDSGGWRTVTTKARINQVASEYRLPFRVQQDRGQWYVTYRPGDAGAFTVEFEDGLTFPVLGTI